jgi:hypothetical protein
MVLSLMRIVGEVPVTVDQIRELAGSRPRSYEAIVRGRVKFRIGQIVYLSLVNGLWLPERVQP